MVRDILYGGGYLGVVCMQLSIDFDELVEAVECSDVMQHYFIDTKENVIIYVNEDIDEDAEEKLETLEDERFMMIPPRLPQDNFLIMQLFVYEKIQDVSIAEKFYRVLDGRKPFRNFKDLLLDYPNLREQWFAYSDRYFRNVTINWLCNNNITLKDPLLIPDIEVREVICDEICNLPGEIADFHPVRCLQCQNEKGLLKRLFLVNVAAENLLIEQRIKDIMKQRFNVGHYGWWSGDDPNILTVSQCPKCKSEYIIWDY